MAGGLPRLVERRIAAIQRSRDLALIERQNANVVGRARIRIVGAAIENWLFDRLEAADLWPRDVHPFQDSDRCASWSMPCLATGTSGAPSICTQGGNSDAHATVVALIQRPASRISMRCALQRQRPAQTGGVAEHLGDAAARRRNRCRGGRSLGRAMLEVVRRSGRGARRRGSGLIPDSRQIQTGGYRDGASWKLRRALDVPRHH